MKIKITLTIITLVLNALVNAQTLQISGKVTDEQNAPVEYADVLLCKNAAVTQYCMSDMAGVFSLAAERGTYDLIIRQLGDTLYAQTIDLQQNIDLGKIAVAQKSKILQEVTVTVQKPLFERKADRMVFNTANLPSADGGDALDLLKLTPSLLVDDNSISIVGKGLMAVMINNRVVQLSGDELINFLKGLRANDIQSVEVITTPPAKYEAEGNGGMINIVLKKTPQNLWNASIFGSYEQTKYGYGNIGGNFN
ncbi:MAG: carboxypeptidase-like regulatory domain-containing protein, partial [Prevotellaceae bacterium]|nr:carboxypeptidase-like regulatory domain-containing protein [Prevotellaceae bacterium]